MPEGVAAAMAGAEGGGAYLVHAGKRSKVPRGGWMPLTKVGLAPLLFRGYSLWLFVFAEGSRRVAGE